MSTSSTASQYVLITVLSSLAPAFIVDRIPSSPCGIVIATQIQYTVQVFESHNGTPIPSWILFPVQICRRVSC